MSSSETTFIKVSKNLRNKHEIITPCTSYCFPHWRQIWIKETEQLQFFVSTPFPSLFGKNEIQFGTNENQFGTNEIQFGRNEIQFSINETYILFLSCYFHILA